MSRLRQPVLALAALAVAASIANPARAQVALEHTNNPFFENLLYHNQVYGIEMVGQRLKMAEAFSRLGHKLPDEDAELSVDPDDYPLL